MHNVSDAKENRNSEFVADNVISLIIDRRIGKTILLECIKSEIQNKLYKLHIKKKRNLEILKVIPGQWQSVELETTFRYLFWTSNSSKKS